MVLVATRRRRPVVYVAVAVTSTRLPFVEAGAQER
jgi:hypothetical protein